MAVLAHPDDESLGVGARLQNTHPKALMSFC
jgi:LmbE family N-acetylglucosaminyl deacetylase